MSGKSLETSLGFAGVNKLQAVDGGSSLIMHIFDEILDGCPIPFLFLLLFLPIPSIPSHEPRHAQTHHRDLRHHA